MTSRTERFWISFILRFAFGFLFLIAAINIFSTGGPHDFGPHRFAMNLSKSFSSGWMGNLLPEVEITIPQPEPASKKKANTAGAAEGAPAAPVAGDGAEKPAAAPARNKGKTEKVHPTYFFLLGLPFVFAALAVPILLGIFLRPALRLGAILLVMLGLGKYIADSTDLSTTANDFFFAFLICVGLYFLGQQDRQAKLELEHEV